MLLVAEVPPAVVTVTSTLPLLPAGLTTVIWVSLSTLKLLAVVEPNETLVAPVKPEPVIVTLVPPAAGPLVGVIPDTIGLGIGAVVGETVGVVTGLLPPRGLGQKA